MPRTKTGVVRRRRHKKILDRNKGYYGSRSTLIKRAKEANMRTAEHAFRGRKNKKRNMKTLWIIRLNAALNDEGYKYSEFIHKLNQSDIKLDRKVLSELAIQDNEAFKFITKEVMASK